MEFFDVISGRYSVRAYEQRPVEAEKLDQVLEAARLAPTACNLQPFQIYVLETAKYSRQALGEVYSQSWFADAPLVLAVCAQTDRAWTRRDGKNYSDVDAAIVMDHIILAATALGLGSCWIGAFNAEAAKLLLHLEDGVEPVVLTPLGYAAGKMPPKCRRLLEELVVRP